MVFLVLSTGHDQHQLLFSHKADISHKQSREESDQKTEGSRQGPPLTGTRGRKRWGTSGVSKQQRRGGEAGPPGDKGEADFQVLSASAGADTRVAVS